MFQLFNGTTAAAALAATALIAPQQASAQDGPTICFVTFSL